LQRKKNKAKKKFHKADGKESLYDISQKYGVKLSRLVKYNEVKEKTILPKGKRVYLKKKPKKHK
jgi:LysM repeat protein